MAAVGKPERLRPTTFQISAHELFHRILFRQSYLFERSPVDGLTAANEFRCCRTVESLKWNRHFNWMLLNAPRCDMQQQYSNTACTCHRCANITFHSLSQYAKKICLTSEIIVECKADKGRDWTTVHHKDGPFQAASFTMQYITIILLVPPNKHMSMQTSKCCYDF